jgi:SAM-dependent methyltransferase
VSDFSAELDRIRAAYGRRRENGRYAWSAPGQLFVMQTLERRVLGTLAAQGLLPLGGKRVLDVGCGTGHSLREFVKWGARPEDVVGVDLLPDRIEGARLICPPGIQLFSCDASDLPFPDGEFDLVVQFTVFSSMLDSGLRRRVAHEMVRVLRPSGVVLWYDFHVPSPHNRDVRAVGRREIADLFPGCRIALDRATLAPPIVRLLAPRSWLLCQVLDTIPLLRTHYLGVIRKA